MDKQDLENRESDFEIAKDNDQVIFQPHHQLAAKTKLREKDLKPQLIYFYRNIGYEPPQIVYYDEGEAAFMEKSSWKPYLKPIGCSDGSAYKKVIRGCGVQPGALIPKQKATEILRKALAAELAQAKKNGYVRPQDQNIHFDNSFPVDQRASFVPPK